MATSEDRERQRVVLELDPDAEPIAGNLRSASGATSEFAGYLALIEAIEAIRSEEDQTA